MSKFTANKILWISIIISMLITVGIYFLSQNLNHIDLLPDQGPLWYYWKLPQPEMWARITAWGFFALHLISIVVVYFLASKHKKAYDNNLSKYNYWMIGLNLFFVLLHAVQTYFWYDALAQDTPVWLSQFSVIIMLVLALIMLNDRRGLFFGKKISFPRNVVNEVYKWHGYYVILATVYTFWFHPMEGTAGHLMGFFYMFLLFIQANMIYTNIHINKYWMFVLEFFVLIHGTIVAILQNNNMWPMFAFGFGFLAIVTQIYLLNLKKGIRIALQLLYVLALILIYGGLGSFRSFSKVYEVTFIPLIEYLLVFVFVGMIWARVKFTMIINRS